MNIRENQEFLDMHDFSLPGITSSPFVFPSRLPLEYERDYSNNDKDYHQPFCDFHSEAGYPLQAHNEKNQSKYKENYCKIN
jgi:hypothetical protein